MTLTMPAVTKTLFVVDKAPDKMDRNAVFNQINSIKGQNIVTIYIHDEGVRWLLADNWNTIYHANEDIIYYANADDAQKFGVPMQHGIILSNPKTLYQLIHWADQIYYLS